MNARRTLSVVGLVFGSAICSPLSTNAQTLPALPQSYVDTSYPVQSGQSIPVSAGGDFQGALNSAQPGDTILLAAGGHVWGRLHPPVPGGRGGGVLRRSGPGDRSPPQRERRAPTCDAPLA